MQDSSIRMGYQFGVSRLYAGVVL